MYTHSRVEVDTQVAEEVIRLYKGLDIGNGGLHGTWHSRRIRDNPYPWFESTFARVKSSIGDLKISEWWFNCGEPGDEYRWHEHGPYPYAAVLYIKTPENCGGIEFRKQEEYSTFNPTIGDFLLFPGNLAHRVLTNNSRDYRISVAFNLNGK